MTQDGTPLQQAMLANRRAAEIPGLPGHVRAALLTAGALAQSHLDRQRHRSAPTPPPGRESDPGQGAEVVPLRTVDDGEAR